MKRQVRKYAFAKDVAVICPFCGFECIAGKPYCKHLTAIDHSIFPTQEITEKFVWTFEKRRSCRVHFIARR
jgi:hypothetical protein